MSNKVIIEFGKSEDAAEVKVNITFEGATVMEIAVASLQLQKVVIDQIGEKEALDLFKGLSKGQTIEQSFQKPTTEA